MLKQPKQSTTSGSGQANLSHELGSADVIEEWVDATMKTALSLDPKSYIPELFWSHDTRPDGRIFGQARPTSIAMNVLEQNAIGSALVKFTSLPSANKSTSSTPQTTHVLAGVTAEIGQPTGQEGDLKITCVPTNASLESWLQRLLLQVVDLEQLGILAGRAAFGLDISIAVLNQDGNITDACLLAAVAALRSTTLPPIVERDGRIFTLESDQERANLPSSWTSFPSKKLSLPVIPLPLSMGYMRISNKKENEDEQRHWLVDPSREEEMVCEGEVTVVVDGCNLEQMLSLDYQGQISITQSNLALALRMAQGRAKELLPLLQSGS